MWTEERRWIFRREGSGYPSDLRDAEWALTSPARPSGRPRNTGTRAAMNAILHLLRTGCPWRYLPRDSFPRRSTVYNIFASSSVTASGRRFGPTDRCRFGEKTFARASGNGSNAPITAIGVTPTPLLTPEP